MPRSAGSGPVFNKRVEHADADAAEKAGGGPIFRRQSRRLQSVLEGVGAGSLLLKKKENIFFSNSSSRAKNCGKKEKPQEWQDFGSPQPCCGKKNPFPRHLSKGGFSTGRFSFSTEESGKKGGEKAAESPRKMGRPRQCRDVILVFSSFTVSAKAGSFVIFFSTWLMEYITVVWSRLLKSRPMLS